MSHATECRCYWCNRFYRNMTKDEAQAENDRALAEREVRYEGNRD